MTNCEMTLDGNILTLKVDISKRYGDSASGKTVQIATTAGNISCPEHPDVKIGLNVYIKKEKQK